MLVRCTRLQAEWPDTVSRHMGVPSVLRLRRRKGTLTSSTCLPIIHPRDCAADQCSIYLVDLDPDDLIVQLLCNHVYHDLCAARWLSQSTHHTCPSCRDPVFGN